MSFLCNEVINIYKECLHRFENFSDKEYLQAMCFKEQVEMANVSTSMLDPQQKFSCFWKAELHFL